MNGRSTAKTHRRRYSTIWNVSRLGGGLLLAGLLIAVTGCNRQDIRIYTVPKETTRQEVAASSGGGDLTPDSKPGLTWKTPEGWNEVPPGEMRVASFRVNGENGRQADVSIVPLPGLAGRDLDNVNRWRGQVGLPPVAESELTNLAQPITVAGQSGQLYELAGKATGSDDPTRILAVVLRREGTAWFFKMTGDDDLVGKQKPVFVDFLRNLNFESSAAAAAELPPSHPPINSGSIASSKVAASAPNSNSGKPTWQVPAGWHEVDAGEFLVAKFLVAGEAGAQAAINVSMSAGDGGGLEANVNRWRGQLGLPSLSAAEVASSVQALDLPDGKAMLIEMNGTDARTRQASRLVGAIVPKGAQTWFYKLMGNQAVVDREKKAFTTFVETAKY